MIKDVYLFTDGSLAVFDEAGQPLPEFSIGKLDLDKKEKLSAGFYDGTRITLARWKRGFFELTREEFLAAKVNNDLGEVYLALYFPIDEGQENEANRTS
jgi:hypothetical protein